MFRKILIIFGSICALVVIGLITFWSRPSAPRDPNLLETIYYRYPNLELSVEAPLTQPHHLMDLIIWYSSQPESGNKPPDEWMDMLYGREDWNSGDVRKFVQKHTSLFERILDLADKPSQSLPDNLYSSCSEEIGLLELRNSLTKYATCLAAMARNASEDGQHDRAQKILRSQTKIAQHFCQGDLLAELVGRPIEFIAVSHAAELYPQLRLAESLEPINQSFANIYRREVPKMIKGVDENIKRTKNVGIKYNSSPEKIFEEFIIKTQTLLASWDDIKIQEVE